MFSCEVISPGIGQEREQAGSLYEMWRLGSASRPRSSAHLPSLFFFAWEADGRSVSLRAQDQSYASHSRSWSICARRHRPGQASQASGQGQTRGMVSCSKRKMTLKAPPVRLGSIPYPKEWRTPPNGGAQGGESQVSPLSLNYLRDVIRMMSVCTCDDL